MSEAINVPSLTSVLEATCKLLQQSLDDIDAPIAKLSSRRQALGVVDFIRQVVSQAQIGAVGADFATAAGWLTDFYQAAAKSLEEQSGTSLLSISPAPTTGVHLIIDECRRRALLWEEAAAATLKVLAGDLEQPSAVGIVRIWTYVSAATVSLVTSGRFRNPAEVASLRDIMVSTSREAAEMAASMLQ